MIAVAENEEKSLSKGSAKRQVSIDHIVYAVLETSRRNGQKPLFLAPG
jgi:hypothetical protein